MHSRGFSVAAAVMGLAAAMPQNSPAGYNSATLATSTVDTPTGITLSSSTATSIGGSGTSTVDDATFQSSSVLATSTVDTPTFISASSSSSATSGSNSSTSAGSGSSGSGSGSDASGSTFTIPAAVVVDPAAASAAADANKALAKDVDSEVTQVQRFNKLLTVDGKGTDLLPQDQLQARTVFNFNKAQDTGKGGRFVLANVNTFPILDQLNIATAAAFLKPCSMNSPHSHPRATEFLTVVQGNITAGFILENGFVDPDKTGAALASEVKYSVGAFEGTVFPQGSIHYQFNDNCEPATFIATLNSDDPGTLQGAQNFFFLDDEVVEVALGDNIQINGDNIDAFRQKIPGNLVQAVDSCMKKCGY